MNSNKETYLAVYTGPNGPIAAAFEAETEWTAVRAAIRNQERNWRDSVSNELELSPRACPTEVCAALNSRGCAPWIAFDATWNVYRNPSRHKTKEKTKEQLEENIATAVRAVYTAKDAVNAAEEALEDFLAAPTQNIFNLGTEHESSSESLIKKATEAMHQNLCRRASRACKGSKTRPPKEYRGGFIVESAEYAARLVVEYTFSDGTYSVDTRKSTLWTKLIRS